MAVSCPSAPTALAHAARPGQRHHDPADASLEPGSSAAVAAAEIDIEALFRQHAATVAAIGFRILGRGVEIEDLVQDVFVDACRDLHKLRNPDAVVAWLSVCTIRRARKRLRARRLRRLLGFDQEVDYETIAHPTASAAQRAVISRLYGILDKLPTADRLAWTLRHVEGEELESVARLCGCSLATAKRRIARAADEIQRGLA